LFFLVGCADIYSPITPNISNFNRKYEFHGEVVGNLNGLNLKSAFSPINHICLQYNARFSTSNNGTELVIGGYNLFTSTGYNQFSFGYGTGKFDYGDPYNGSDFDLTKATGKYKKLFGQLHFIFATNKKVLNGFCFRIEKVKVSYSDANISDYVGNTYDVILLEPFYTREFQVTKHSSFLIYTGVILNSQSNLIRTSAINIGAGLAVKLFNVNK
jgi:hypothetical protein